ncbi:hypothetical protein CANCADRAFT_1589 [Tortispora caseinolytica NRRL Y-17796]|uniref:Imidazole glycerol phosphate synthase hisHF n=1 Tax=Tortispora caseinolytica NRRL Y-17796 TaxID=767744 RepID=A0A1E4TDM2_9ASCO|nr:hypothetical protein CANCADRAFT_1589 [Tortispora caseinolytica NRRL Y-17796]
MTGTVHVVDVESGNLESLKNAIEWLGYSVKWVTEPEQLKDAEKLIFPGVGNYGHFVGEFTAKGFKEPVIEYINSGKPFMGICVGLQALFTSSVESPGTEGLDLIHDSLLKFDPSTKSVPQIGWAAAKTGSLYGVNNGRRFYFVHSYRASPEAARAQGWEVVTAQYGDEEYIAALCKDNIFATQFHPEKSGKEGIKVIGAFLKGDKETQRPAEAITPGLAKRVIACLDVRTNDQGDLVVTKGDQYDVREKSSESGVRNLGKPVTLAQKYSDDGADEITFLNITSFRNSPLKDAPMLEVLRQTAKSVFVPLTVGGGIRDIVEPDGTVLSALTVASMYFRSGADKVSIGSDAVFAAEEYYASGKILSGKTAIETISRAFGAQAVIVSVDPKRVYVSKPEDTKHHTIHTEFKGPNGEEYCWYQCSVKGGREFRDLDVQQLVQAVEAMGAGEILLNCIDKDGSNSGFDLELIQDVKDSVRIPVIASSGAGNPAHFVEVFQKTTTDAALGAGIFHREEYRVSDVKKALKDAKIPVRL